MLRSQSTSPAEPDGYAFASDNTAGLCPEALAAIQEANAGFHSSYGEDPWTAQAADAIRALFETDCEVFFVFNGSAANSLALASGTRSFQSVLCHEYAHVATDECGGPEFFTGGSKILPIAGAQAKLTPDAVETRIHARKDLHFPKAGMLSLTQATELGTVYQPSEIEALSAVAHASGLKVHLDGARFANAAASLAATVGASPADFTWRAGIDILSLGGTKNGLNATEAVVIFDRELAQDFAARGKQACQLYSKLRFASAQWAHLLSGGAYLRHAAHANAMAQQLRAGLARIPGISFGAPTEANAVFARLPPAVAAQIEAAGWHVYDFIGDAGHRMMCSWATTPELVERFLTAVRVASSKPYSSL